MNTMKILFVEDTKGEQQSFNKVIDDFNQKYHLTVESDIVEDTWSALAKIDNSYNGAIINMLLGDDSDGGNKIIRELANLPIKVPVICVTSYPHLIERHSFIIRERSRDDGSYESDLLLFQKRLNAELEPKETTQTYTALIRESEGWWIGWILEVRGVTCQERTKSELLDTLQITLREMLEFDKMEVCRRTENETAEIKASDILEFSTQEALQQTENVFEEVRFAI